MKASILACILFTLVVWGMQASLLLLAQDKLGPWKTILMTGGGFALTAVLVGAIGILFGENQKEFNDSGAWLGMSSGACSCLGGVSITLAFMIAKQSGDNYGSVWITPAIVGLLPISYAVFGRIILPKPAAGWGQLISPWYLAGIVFVIVGVVLMTINRLK